MTNEKLLKAIDDMVYGHEKAKRVLNVLLKRSQDRYYRKCVLGEQDVPATLKCLLIGESGTGKTHLVQSLKKIHKFPLLSLDATQFTPSGNREGINVQQLTKMIRDASHEYTKKPEFHSPEGVLNQMVIFVDEFDKLGMSYEASGNWNKQVQANFLTLIENNEEFEGISWVFAGAFSSLYERKSSPKNKIGFFSDSIEEEEEEFTDEDILKAGIIPEMLGRINLIVQLDTLTEEDLKNILHRQLSGYNFSLDVDKEIEIVSKALKSGQGVRSLKRQLEMLAIEKEFEKQL